MHFYDLHMFGVLSPFVSTLWDSSFSSSRKGTRWGEGAAMGYNKKAITSKREKLKRLRVFLISIKWVENQSNRTRKKLFRSSFFSLHCLAKCVIRVWNARWLRSLQNPKQKQSSSCRWLYARDALGAISFDLYLCDLDGKKDKGKWKSTPGRIFIVSN